MAIELLCVKTVLESYNPNLSFSSAVNRKMRTKKFMQTLDSKQFVELEDLAKKRGTNVQTFIRAIVIPEWLVTLQGEGPVARSKPLRGQGRRLKERRVATRSEPSCLERRTYEWSRRESGYVLTPIYDILLIFRRKPFDPA